MASERPTSAGRGPKLRAAPALVLVVGLLATLLGAVAARSSYQDTERRLLAQRLDEIGAVLRGSLPGLTAPLSGAAELAEATEADPEAVERLLAPVVGEDGPFSSVSIWSAGDATPTPLVVVGDQPELASLPPEQIRADLDRALASPSVTVTDLLEAERPALGFSYTSSRADPAYVIHAENLLPEDRTAVRQEDNAYSDLDYALYLGDSTRPDDLLVASREDLRVPEPANVGTVPFGDQELTIAIRPNDDLAGPLSARLPWMIAVVGTLFSAAFALLTARLLGSRDAAVALAEENGRLYAEQRSVAHAVQQSLLPARLPEIPGMEVEVRYQPGVHGIEVGGDWYDVVELDGDRVLVVVGDVAGRGLQAATVMAMLRHAVRAYAADGDEPTTIAPKLTRLMDLDADGGFATALFLVIDRATRSVSVVNAGHPRPLLVEGGQARFVEAPADVPLGIEGRRDHRVSEFTMGPGATLLAFTDGLFERRGESVDEGMERLRSAVVADRPLADMLDGLLDTLAGGGEEDDIAIVGVRW